MKYRLRDPKTLIIVSGGSGTGKTRTAEELLKRLTDRVCRISYDTVKEQYWDRFGFDNASEKKELDNRSLEAFYEQIDRNMKEGNPVLVEYPFYQFHRERLRKLTEDNGYRCVTVYLHTDPKTAYERGVLRDAETDRHPGHLLSSYHKERFQSQDLAAGHRHVQAYDEFLEFIDGRNYNVDLGIVVDVDVTDFSSVSYDAILDCFCRQADS